MTGDGESGSREGAGSMASDMARRATRLAKVERWATGPLLIIGGRFEDDNHRLFQAIHDHSGGNVLVFATASGFPEEVGMGMVEDLRQRGTSAEYVDLTLENSDRMAFDPGLVARVAQCGGVYFTGGDQLRITQSLIRDGRETPVLAALRALNARGGLIAGSSAGAAMQSDPMLLGGSSLDALTIGPVDDPDTPGISVGPGLGFFPLGLIDQHFIERARIGRLVAGVRLTGQRFGFGIDENTGILVRNGIAEVIGETGLVVVDMKHAVQGPAEGALSNIRVSYLDDGDRFDLMRGKARPGAGKKRLRPNRPGAFRTPADMPRDVFGAYALHELWQRLALGDPRVYDREEASVRDPRNGRRVTLTLRRRPRVSLVYRDAQERLSMHNFLLSLAVEDVRQPAGTPPHVEAVREPRNDLPSTPVAAGFGADPAKAPDASFRKGSSPLPGVLARPVFPPKAGHGTVAIAGCNAMAPLQPEPVEVSFRRVSEPVVTHRPDTRGNTGSAALLQVSTARQIVVETRLRDHITHRVTRLGESGPYRNALQGALQSGAAIFGADEAAAAFGEEAITYGDASAAIRWGVSSDAGVEGVVVEPALGLVPGIVHPGIGEAGVGIGRLLIACAERRRVGWGLQRDSVLTFDAAKGRMEYGSGQMSIQVWVEPDKVRSAQHDLDIRDIYIVPLRAGGRPATGEAAHDAILALVDHFAEEIGATREPEGAGISWLGRDVLLRAHLREAGACSLDISCHRARMTAAIR
ncbi:cyanophycinase [Aliiruegeria haliotis]|uniref:Cyanophycinase n=1 Tax=Aliiruegeria haliotis TaxID=1280846 RepID=A0A2T0RIK4_9RHOB|nr:cyanophycinase [Aliiruegeria haliotis]PRY20957.1 cyanophycinase [Aliiruegeria haliotis]